MLFYQKSFWLQTTVGAAVVIMAIDFSNVGRYTDADSRRFLEPLAMPRFKRNDAQTRQDD